MSTIVPRHIETGFKAALTRGKSILLLGPRQTGKTTFVEQQLKPDISYSFARLQTRLRYEKNPELLEKELEEQLKEYDTPPIIFIDEVQKVPQIMDTAQHLIDKKLAQFILTGSSARKLKHGSELNLLPGRVTVFYMTPLSFQELPQPKPSLEDLLLYGSLPGIISESSLNHKENDLYTYVETYLEEEIRAEAAVRNVGSFARFLEIAAGESGRQVNFSSLSQNIGVATSTVSNYYQILEDCLIVSRIDPITKSKINRRLIKSPKHLFFDLGIRRACANEGTRLPQSTLGDLFEHYVGNELLIESQFFSPQCRLRYWRDTAGPEIDYILDMANTYIPIEVKWTEAPKVSDAKHMVKFMKEYSESTWGYVICRTPKRYKLADNILALPWEEIPFIFEQLAKE